MIVQLYSYVRAADGTECTIVLLLETCILFHWVVRTKSRNWMQINGHCTSQIAMLIVSILHSFISLTAYRLFFAYSDFRKLY
jgi:hypothetical protein